MRLVDISNIIKGNIRWVILLLLALLSFILVFSWFTNKQKVPPIKQISSPLKQPLGVQRIVFKGNWPNFPKTIAVAEIEDDSKKLGEKVIMAASGLGFKNAPQKKFVGSDSEVWTWNDKNILNYYPRKRVFNFSYNTIKDPSVLEHGKRPTIQTAQATVLLELKNLGLPTEGLVLDQNKSFLSEGKSTETNEGVPPSQANVAHLTFNWTLNGILVLKEFPVVPMVQVWIARDNKLIFLDYTFLKDYSTGKKNIKILSEEQTLNALQSGLGTVAAFSLDSPRKKTVSSPQISSAEIESVNLAYLQTELFQSYFQPIFVFRGRAVTAMSETGEIVIYLPATSESSS